MVEQVRDVASLRDAWADALSAFNARFHPWQDGRAAERVVDGLLGCPRPAPGGRDVLACAAMPAQPSVVRPDPRAHPGAGGCRLRWAG